MPRRAILIGNSRFPLAPELEPLGGPPNDVSRLAKVLADYGQFEKIDLLVDRDSRDVHRAIEAALLNGRPSDFLLIFYSGHGTPDTMGNLCLATADTEDGVMGATSVLMSNIKNWVSASALNQIVVILDCCYSGALWNSFGAKGDPKTHVKVLLNDVADGTRRSGRGISLFASSSATQRSREETADATGAMMGRFTRCVVNGLLTARSSTIPGAITVDDLRHYVGDHWNYSDQTPDYWGLKSDGNVVLVNRSAGPGGGPPPPPPWLLTLVTTHSVELLAGLGAAMPLSVALLGLLAQDAAAAVASWIVVLMAASAVLGAYCARFLVRRQWKLRRRKLGQFLVGLSVGMVTLIVLLGFYWLSYLR